MIVSLSKIEYTYGPKSVSVCLNIPYSNIYYYYKKAIHPDFHSLKRGGKRTGLSIIKSKIVYHAVLFYITRQPVTILKDIRQFVMDVHQIKRSISWYSRFMAKVGITWKCVELKEINKYSSINLER